MNKISGVYQIVNLVTHECYVGSSKDTEKRWKDHKWPSMWNQQPNSRMYKDMQKYGLENFVFQVLTKVEPEYLKEAEQKYIEMLKPTYNKANAKGLNIENKKKYLEERQKGYEQTEERKEYKRKNSKKYNSQLCSYNGEILKLQALSVRFVRQCIPHPAQEAKKYLIK